MQSMVIFASSKSFQKQVFGGFLKNKKPPSGGVCFLLDRGGKGTKTNDYSI